MSTAIAVDGVSKFYRDHAALTGVGFSLPAGACLALLGHNGAGKTTLMKLMLGLIRPTAGSVRVLGRDPAGAALDFRRQLGFLPENVAFHDEMTGRETLRFFARLKGEGGAACDDLLERVGLAFAAHRRVKTYSKGMRQRLGLAQALLGRPRVLLLDEPTTGLDPVLRVEFFRIIAELTKSGSTVVLSSHILTELEARTELVAIMRQGRLAAWGSLEQLRRQAGLPIRIRLSTPGGARAVADRLGGLALDHVNEHAVELSCALPDKMEVLRHIAGVGALVADMDIHLPSLDDLYVHFGHEEGSA
ncbi:MAG: ABC transporter ATP-binding protein [Magnetospirillum sp.]|nr:ABC transporter ATP-binding protein [Magnetospirillum sp.]